MKKKPHDLSGEELLEAIEKGQSDHPLVADLMATPPPANQHFKQQLEDRLIERLNNQSKGLLKIQPLPLTLIASLLIVFAFGMVMLALNATSDSTPLQASDDSVPVVTATPVPVRPTEEPVGVTRLTLEDFVPVVVANRDIPLNAQITSDFLMVVYMPSEQIEASQRATGLNGFFNAVDDVLSVDRYANQAIPQFLPLRGDMLDETPLIAYDEDGQFQARIPPNSVAIAIPVDSLTSERLQSFDNIAIVIGMQFVDVDREFQRSESDVLNAEFRMQILIDSAMVLHVGEFPPPLESGRVLDEDEIPSLEASTPDEIPDIITLAVSPEQATILTWVLESNLPYVIVPLN